MNNITNSNIQCYWHGRVVLGHYRLKPFDDSSANEIGHFVTQCDQLKSKIKRTIKTQLTSVINKVFN